MDFAEARRGHPRNQHCLRRIQIQRCHGDALPLFLERVLRLVCRGEQGRFAGESSVGQLEVRADTSAATKMARKANTLAVIDFVLVAHAAAVPSVPAVHHGGTLARDGLRRGHAGKSGRQDHHVRAVAQAARRRFQIALRPDRTRRETHRGAERICHARPQPAPHGEHRREQENQIHPQTGARTGGARRRSAQAVAQRRGGRGERELSAGEKHDDGARRVGRFVSAAGRFD